MIWNWVLGGKTISRPKGPFVINAETGGVFLKTRTKFQKAPNMFFKGIFPVWGKIIQNPLFLNLATGRF